MFDDVRRRPYVFCGGNAPTPSALGLQMFFGGGGRREQGAAAQIKKRSKKEKRLACIIYTRRDRIETKTILLDLAFSYRREISLRFYSIRP
jgi:hypothetical protein